MTRSFVLEKRIEWEHNRWEEEKGDETCRSKNAKVDIR